MRRERDFTVKFAERAQFDVEKIRTL